MVKRVTIAGTNIDDVKRRNAASGLSYNEAKLLLARRKEKDCYRTLIRTQ